MTVQGLCRAKSKTRIAERSKPWDLVVIGGGATGVSVALDAASRGLEVVLVERADFGSGTSSRSTKLIHGGVRYLRQGNFSLVREALEERELLKQNAPHLVTDLPFMIPCESWWNRFVYGCGLKLYDWLGGRSSFGRSRGIHQAEARKHQSTIEPTKISRGGVIYHDGQFDDARLVISIALAANDHHACLLNYASVVGLLYDEEHRVAGVRINDGESGETSEIYAKGVINATGPFCDDVRRLDAEDCASMIVPSQGVHLVLPKQFLPGDTAFIVPKTDDGRVIFIIPWHQQVLVGTTDTAIQNLSMEPVPQQVEIDELLETASRYLTTKPTRSDVQSVFTGIRPLVRSGEIKKTAALSREHVIRESGSRMLTVAGGKWTTARRMAEDAVDHAIRLFQFTDRPCCTKNLRLHGFSNSIEHGPRSYLGSDLEAIAQLEIDEPSLAFELSSETSLRRSDVVWSVRYEMARTLDDVLSRRTRVLVLNAQLAMQLAPSIAEIMAQELGQGAEWIDQQVATFLALAKDYQVQN